MATRVPTPRAVNDRVVRLEVQHEATLDALKDLIARLEQLDTRFDTVEKSLVKYQGIVGGVMLVGGALSALFALFGDFLQRKLFGVPTV